MRAKNLSDTQVMEELPPYPEAIPHKEMLNRLERKGAHTKLDRMVLDGMIQKIAINKKRFYLHYPPQKR